MNVWSISVESLHQYWPKSIVKISLSHTHTRVSWHCVSSRSFLSSHTHSFMNLTEMLKNFEFRK